MVRADRELVQPRPASVISQGANGTPPSRVRVLVRDARLAISRYDSLAGVADPSRSFARIASTRAAQVVWTTTSRTRTGSTGAATRHLPHLLVRPSTARTCRPGSRRSPGRPPVPSSARRSRVGDRDRRLPHLRQVGMIFAAASIMHPAGDDPVPGTPRRTAEPDDRVPQPRR